MIVSASYRTDIPAFYAEWFANRLEAGYCLVANPYGGPPSRVDLRPQAVEGYVFWTRNAAPFLPVLARVRRDTPFVVQYTVTGYPHALEASVIPAERSVALIRRLAEAYGPQAAVWRYDPVLFTSLTPPAWHRARFAELAAALEGSVDEAVVSVANIYRKTARNTAAAAAEHGFAWHDPPEEDKRALLAELAAIAARHGMRLTLCGQAGLLAPGIAEARCIDAARLSQVAGRPLAAERKPHRDCGCARSRDIGAYDSCPHGCVYCYAVGSRMSAKRAFAAHDPLGEFMRQQVQV